MSGDMTRPLDEIASSLGLRPEEIDPYGRNKAKVRLDTLRRLQGAPDGRLVLVTAINPTPAGEGKTVTTIGLGDALASLGKRTIVNIREPSLGPVFGVKGGGAGGGMARAVPGEELNLHFTGDFHAITAAHNLLAALIDAHIFHENKLGFTPHGVAWQRVLDVTDRSLRNVITGLGGHVNGIPREASFAITAASEVMATVAAARSLEGLSERLARLVIGTREDGAPITCGELGAVAAMVLLLRDAMNPNLIQTVAGTPLLAHTGPFGNLATGHNSVCSDEMSLKLADIVVTEAGFGSDLGFEKFCHLVSPVLGRSPAAVVVVATVRALKSNSSLVPRLVPGKPLPKELEEENIAALEDGAANLKRHVENVRQFGLPVVVAVNRFPSDTKAELDKLAALAKSFGASACAVSEVFTKGGAEGGRALGAAVLSVLES
jgi:formate--tetrahydrofolate ligase